MEWREGEKGENAAGVLMGLVSTVMLRKRIRRAFVVVVGVGVGVLVDLFLRYCGY